VGRKFRGVGIEGKAGGKRIGRIEGEG